MTTVSSTGRVTFESLGADFHPGRTSNWDWQPDGIVEKAGAALGFDQRQVDSSAKDFKQFIENRRAETGALAWGRELTDPARAVRSRQRRAADLQLRPAPRADPGSARGSVGAGRRRRQRIGRRHGTAAADTDGVEVIALPENIGAAARNLGVEHALDPVRGHVRRRRLVSSGTAW